MTVITIHMRKNDGLENYLKKKKIFFFFVFSHPGGSVSLPGVRELGCISGRNSLPRRVCPNIIFRIILVHDLCDRLEFSFTFTLSTAE